MRKAFTLLELIVALGILAVVLSFAGLIFRVSIDSHLMALANAEIMQKLRVITEQLDSDFKKAHFKYGGRIEAHTTTYTTEVNDVEVEVAVNSDSIVFFANGDFQSTEQYDGQTVVGNVAVIFYGHPDPCSYDRPPEPKDHVLLRRQTILAPYAPGADSDPNGEYYLTSLEQWRAGALATDLKGWARRPLIDANDLRAQQPMYLARGVHDFTISYLDADANEPTTTTEAIDWRREIDEEGTGVLVSIRPHALRFTFTLYDSRGIIKKGRTFTHIVLVDI
jgi:prepilin-type N-terminal cleavage/methylation domain-containing protein